MFGDPRNPNHQQPKPTSQTISWRYIDYNVKKLAKPGSIARHTDNDSMVTMVVPWRLKISQVVRFGDIFWHLWTDHI